MPETREIAYQDADLRVQLVVGAASVLAGMKRALLIGRAEAYLKEVSPSSTGQAVAAAARTLIARTLYPDCLAAVVTAEGLDVEMDVAAFLQLPEGLTDAWQNAVYALNPHWYPFRREADEDKADEKKAPDSANSASGS